MQRSTFGRLVARSLAMRDTARPSAYASSTRARSTARAGPVRDCERLVSAARDSAVRIRRARFDSKGIGPPGLVVREEPTTILVVLLQYLGINHLVVWIDRLWTQQEWSSWVPPAPLSGDTAAFRNVHPAELGAVAAKAALQQARVAADAVDEVLIGHGRQAGSGPNPARQVGRRAGLPDAVPAQTINKACASGMQAVAGAAQSILLGESAVALAGGVESMSRMPDAAILKAVQEHQVDLRCRRLARHPRSRRRHRDVRTGLTAACFDPGS
ncbi:hypothetical protein BH23ACI1_BH23ACI1_27040 [soil metagenome]